MDFDSAPTKRTARPWPTGKGSMHPVDGLFRYHCSISLCHLFCTHMTPISGVSPWLQAPAVGVALLALPHAVLAGPGLDHGPALGPSDAFELHLLREDLEVAYDDDAGGGDLELTRVGIAFHERLNASIRGAVALGAIGVRQRDRTATADVDPTGWYLGLDFNGIWPREGALRFAAGLGWRYARADRSDEDGDESILDWHTGEVRAALVTGLTPAVDLQTGVAHKWVRGDERFRSDASTTTRFDLDDPVSGFVQLDFLTGRAGVVRFQVRGGNPQGARITFEYNY